MDAVDCTYENSSRITNPCQFITLDELRGVYTSFSAIHVNARDFRRQYQYDNLCFVLEESAVNFDVAVVSETWFGEHDPATFLIKDFTCISANRPGGGGGGVAVYVRSALHLVSSETRCSDDGSVQIVRVQLRRPGFEGFVIGAYSRDREDSQTLLDLLDEMIPTKGRLPCLVMGDTNVDLLLEDDTSHDYCSFFSGKGFVQVVDMVTRPNLRYDAQHSGSCLDHIAVANCENYLQVCPFVVNTVFSDHYPVCITLTGSQSVLSLNVTNCREPSSRRFLGPEGYLRFNEQISGADWSSVTNSEDADEAFNAFNKMLFRIYDECFPLRQCSPKRGKEVSPWFTKDLRDLRRDVDRCQRRYHLTRDLLDKQAYYGLLVIYRERLKSARESHYKRAFESLKRRPAKLWALVNDLCGRGKNKSEISLKLNGDRDGEELSDPQAVVDALNEFFATVGTKTTANLKSLGQVDIPPTASSASNRGTFSLRPIDALEMSRAVKGAKTDLSGSREAVPSRLISDFLVYLSEPLAAVFNLSVSTGTFPAALKTSRVIPLYKGRGSKNDPGNYRPISLVAFVSKIFERIAKRQLEEYLDKINFFSNNQFGFRGARSTELALSHTWHEVVLNAEKGKCCLAAFLDVAKAFDCVDHSRFVSMLAGLGCSELCVSWFSSYLSRRMQRVAVGGLKSRECQLSIGTPQGSVLGPFIFIIYLNFVIRAVENDLSCRPIVYADDTTLLFEVSPNNVECDLRNAAAEVERAIDYFNRFGLVVNSSKTTLVLFSTLQRELVTDQIRLNIKGEHLPLSPNARCLGVLLNQHMKWEPHIKSMSGKCYAVVASLARLRRTGVDITLLLQVYRALFEPVLTYCVTLWGSSYKNVIRAAQVIQNDAIRAITGLSRKTSVSSLYSKLGVLPVEKVALLRQAILGYKSTRGKITPDGPFDFPNHPVRSGRRDRAFCVPKCKLNVASHSLYCRLPAIWNSLPNSIRAATSIGVFKSKYTEVLLEELKQGVSQPGKG